MGSFSRIFRLEGTAWGNAPLGPEATILGKARPSAPPCRARSSICQAISFSVRPGSRPSMTCDRISSITPAAASMALTSPRSLISRRVSTNPFKGVVFTGSSSFFSLLASCRWSPQLTYSSSNPSTFAPIFATRAGKSSTSPFLRVYTSISGASFWASIVYLESVMRIQAFLLIRREPDDSLICPSSALNPER